MVKAFVWRGATPFFLLALLLGLLAGCEKKNRTSLTPASSPAASVSANSTAIVIATPTPAPPISGPVTPVIVPQSDESVAHYLHFPEGKADHDGTVQFYCDITDAGIVEATYALIGQDPAFKIAVQTALDWGRFTPATLHGKPVAAYIGGTVVFTHRTGTPLIVVALATYDGNRIRQLSDFIQPQLIGGLRPEIERLFRNLPQRMPPAGWARAVVKVDARGAVTGTSQITEVPRASGLGALLNNVVAGAHFTPAYDNGKPVPGAIDVVVNFSQL